MSYLEAYYRAPDRTGRPELAWSHAHQRVLEEPARRGLEGSFAHMYRAWLAYADAHKSRYESDIGQDYVLGPHWEAVGKGLLGLLNGDIGRLDAGTCDRVIKDSLHRAGFREEA